jgi:aryl-alcohol dehydrogenase-like predicted oxidoreductase
LISAQHEYSLINRAIQTEVIPAARAMGTGILPYYPLGGGFLTGKYRRGVMPEGARLTNANPRQAGRWVNERNFDLLEKFEAFASERGHSLTELAFAWLLSQPEVGSVIAGATWPEQVDENVAAGQWRLSPEEMAALAAIV